MLHHLQLGLVDLFVNAAQGIAPGYHELGHFKRISFGSELFKLCSGGLAQNLVPRLAIFVGPSEALRHAEDLSIQAQHFSIGNWFVRALQGLDGLLQKTQLASVFDNRFHSFSL